MLNQQPEPRYIAIGRVLRPHGVQGELRVEMLTDFPERWRGLKSVYIGPSHRLSRISSARVHQDVVLLKLEDCDDRNAADALRDQFLYVGIEDVVPLKEGEYYYFQVIGMDVITDNGERLGEVVEVFEAPGANEVFVIHGSRGEILIPAIDEVIVKLDFENEQLTIHLLPGLLDTDQV